MGKVLLGAVAAAALASGCGGGAESSAGPGGGTPPRAGFSATEPEPEPGFDPDDPDISLLPHSHQAEVRLMRLQGHRRDFRVPRSTLAGLAPGPMARAAIARAWHELPAGDSGYHDLSAGQRALLALQWAEAEILNGGFGQFWFNDTGYYGPDLVAAAERVGARDHAAVFRAAAALFPDGRIPRGRAARQAVLDRLDEATLGRLDRRYAELQYRRRTALGLILGRYVRAHLTEFVAG